MYVSREENELFFLLTVPPVQKCFHNNGHLFCFHCNPLLSAKKMYALSSMHLKSRLQTLKSYSSQRVRYLLEITQKAEVSFVSCVGRAKKLLTMEK